MTMIPCMYNDKKITELEDDGMLGLDIQFTVNDKHYKVIDVVTKKEKITELKLRIVTPQEIQKEKLLENKKRD